MKQKIIFFITIFIVFYGSIVFAQDSAGLNPNFNPSISFASDMEAGYISGNEWTTIKGKWFNKPEITIYFKEGMVSYNQGNYYKNNQYFSIDLPSSNIRVASTHGRLKKYKIKPIATLIIQDNHANLSYIAIDSN